MSSLTIDPSRTALVLIDLQQGVVGRPLEPHAGPTILQNAVRLADKFRAAGSLVVLVRVAFSADFKDFIKVPSDVTSPFDLKSLPANWAEIMPELGPKAGDLVITKHQWGAFYGTELELQLRRREVRTIVLGGVATNVGVESTARNAYDLGFAQIFAEDATSTFSAEAHAATMKTTFPRIGQIRSTSEILAAFPA